jgi:hypothetical protein
LAGLTSVTGAPAVHKTAAGAGSDGSGGRERRYLVDTVFVAEPPRLEVTVTVVGLATGLTLSEYVLALAL